MHSILARSRPLASPGVLRAALYCRISLDKRKDKGGVGRQERSGRERCAERGYRLDERHVFIDNSRSAWKRDRKRPGWDALMAAVAAGEIDVIVCVDPDRLMRQPRDLEDLLDLAERGVVVDGKVSGYDLSDPNDRYALRILVAQACKASDDTSRRVRAEQEEAAATGRYHGGQRRYGFEPDGLTVRESEAAVVREMTGMRLRGAGWLRITTWANQAGHTTAQGRRWTVTRVRELLDAPYIAGLRQHQGKIVGAAVWPAIIDEGSFRAMAELREERQSRWESDSAGHRFYRCRGVLVCHCGTRMVGRSGGRGRRCSAPDYACLPAKGGCGASVSAVQVERLVSQFVKARLAVSDLHAGRQPDPAEAEARDAEMSALTGRKSELAAAYGAGEIGMDEWKAARAPVEDRLRELRLPPLRRPSAAVEDLTGPDAAARWDELDPPRQNAIIRTYVEAVIVHPAPHRGGRFDPARLDLRPRDAV